jgi:glycerol-3-phosphate dehydrogenase (NAD(P)+)
MTPADSRSRTALSSGSGERAGQAPEVGSSVLILGYGAFGRAVHAALARRHDLAISVYSRSPKAYEHPPVEVFDRPAAIDIQSFDVVIVALPGHAVREVLEACRGVSPGTAFLSCVKGMDPVSGRFPSDIIYEATGSDYAAVMSGASFADEMLLGRPVFLTLACTNILLGRELIARLDNPMLHLELTDDVRGLEIAGVGKNIIALGAGMADGLELGDNFRATFIARGVVELRMVADKLGGRADTIVAAGALADFFLSCSSPRSRNYSHGWKLAQGTSEPSALAEGWHSAELFVALLRSHHVSSSYFETIVDALGNPALIVNSLPSS